MPRRIANVLAIATTLLGVGSCGASIQMLLALDSGAYEPISDDGMSVEQAAFLPSRLTIIAVLSLAAGTAGTAWLWRTGKPA